MLTLPIYIKNKFYSVPTADISLSEFEQWLYADEEVEQYMSTEDYLEIISLDYRKKHHIYAEDKKLVLTGKVDENGFYVYEDFRTERSREKAKYRLPVIEQNIDKITPGIHKSTARKIWQIFRKRRRYGTILNSKK